MTTSNYNSSEKETLSVDEFEKIWDHEDRLYLFYTQHDFLLHNGQYKYDILVTDKEGAWIYRGRNDFLNRAQRAFPTGIKTSLFILTPDPALPPILEKKFNLISLLQIMNYQCDITSQMKPGILSAKDAYFEYADYYDESFLQIESEPGHYADRKRFIDMVDFYLDLNCRYLIRIYEMVRKRIKSPE